MARVSRGFAPEPPNMHLSCRIDYCTLLSPRVDTSRTGEAKLNLVRLRTFRLREIVFEQNAKSYNFERGFFFIHIPLSLTLSHTARSFTQLNFVSLVQLVSLGEGTMYNNFTHTSY